MAITLGYGYGITLYYILIPYALSGELETIKNCKREFDYDAEKHHQLKKSRS